MKTKIYKILHIEKLEEKDTFYTLQEKYRTWYFTEEYLDVNELRYNKTKMDFENFIYYLENPVILNVSLNNRITVCLFGYKLEYSYYDSIAAIEGAINHIEAIKTKYKKLNSETLESLSDFAVDFTKGDDFIYLFSDLLLEVLYKYKENGIDKILSESVMSIQHEGLDFNY